MRFVVMGAGAIGGVVGGRLAGPRPTASSWQSLARGTGSIEADLLARLGEEPSR